MWFSPCCWPPSMQYWLSFLFLLFSLLAAYENRITHSYVCEFCTFLHLFLCWHVKCPRQTSTPTLKSIWMHWQVKLPHGCNFRGWSKKAGGGTVNDGIWTFRRYVLLLYLTNVTTWGTNTIKAPVTVTIKGKKKKKDDRQKQKCFPLVPFFHIRAMKASVSWSHKCG